MNQTKELWGPFSNALRRALLSTSRFEFSNFNRNFNAQIHFLNSPPSSSSSSSSYSFQDPNSCSRRLFFEKINFCSESAAERAKIATCWSCNAVPKAAPFLFCESCRSVQPVDHSVDYFQIFGLKKNYEIEGENLEGKYKDWQKKIHPDLVHSKSEKEREYAAEQSARVIEAYRTLTKPLPRAIYILRLKGVDVDEEETVSEPELLTEILEIREAVEEATDSRALKEIQSLVQEKLIHWANCFANAFENQRFDEARVCVRRMTYYDRVNEEIAKKL